MPKRTVAIQPISIVVPSISPVYPQDFAKGATLPDEVAAFCRDEGWADEVDSDDSTPAPTTAAMAAAVAAAAAMAGAAGPTPLPRKARMLSATKLFIDGAEQKIAKNAIVEDAFADEMVAAGKAIYITASDGAPETK